MNLDDRTRRRIRNVLTLIANHDRNPGDEVRRRPDEPLDQYVNRIYAMYAPDSMIPTLIAEQDQP